MVGYPDVASIARQVDIRGFDAAAAVAYKVGFTPIIFTQSVQSLVSLDLVE